MLGNHIDQVLKKPTLFKICDAVSEGLTYFTKKKKDSHFLTYSILILLSNK